MQSRGLIGRLTGRGAEPTPAQSAASLETLNQTQQARTSELSRGRAAEDSAGVLAVHNLGKSYGGRAVVKDVSIAVRRGEAVGLNNRSSTIAFAQIMHREHSSGV